MLLARLVEVSRAVAATSARSRKIALIAELLRTSDQAEIAVSYLTGEPLQRRTGVGWAALREPVPSASVPTLGLDDVDAALERIATASGAGVQAKRAAELRSLLGAATPDEQRFLTALITGELRQGALEGVMVEAIAKAADVPIGLLRQACMLRGDIPAVAAIALRDGAERLGAIALRVGQPVRPMLAQSASSVVEALAKVGAHNAALEWKFDGIRVQAHRDGDDVRIFTRTLDDVTGRVPEIVEMVGALKVRDIVLDGEAIALDGDGRPRPFQQTAARTSSRLDVERLRAEIPLSAFFFDVLYLDGEPTIDDPARKRRELLDAVIPEGLRAPRLVTADPERATAFFADAVARGHEGVVVKALDAPYQAGRRGAGWVKVKPRHTLDLVVLAAEWGHGRRRGVLSNLHLGARDGDGGFVMLGKTFKGLTDETLAWQTRELLSREVGRDSYTVYVRPELVVEIAFDGVQTSPRYPGGVALRFARVLRYRPDKTADEADHIDAVRHIHGHGHGSP